MLLIAFILLVIVLFLLVNSGPMAQPNRWICNVLLIVAVILAVLVTFGASIHIGR